MQGLLHSRYAPLVYSSESDCGEPNVEQESEPENKPITDSSTTKVKADPEPSVIVEPEVLDEPESKVVVELVSLQEETPSRPTKVEKPLVEIFVDLPVELTMELLPFFTAMRIPLSLRLLDTYNPWQMFLYHDLIDARYDLILHGDACYLFTTAFTGDECF